MGPEKMQQQFYSDEQLTQELLSGPIQEGAKASGKMLIKLRSAKQKTYTKMSLESAKIWHYHPESLICVENALITKTCGP